MALALSVALAACGGGGRSDQDRVADMLIDSIRESGGTEGVSIDEGCVRAAIDELGDADTAKILAAGPDGTPEGLSADADRIAEAIFTDCVRIEAAGVLDG